MRNTAFLLLGIGLILIQSNLFRLVGLVNIAGITPSLVLPLVVFMGVHEYSLARGALLSFVLGYLVDVFAAAPVGLYTFTSVAIFVVSRVAGVRLAAQTMLTKIGLALAFSLLEGTLVIVLTAIFGKDPSRPRALAALVLPHAAATALFAPLVFRIAQRMHEATTAVPHPEKVTGR
jgi:rod shape-determining protein MreD